MGEFAGHDVAADLLGRDLLPFTPDPYVTCLDLGPAGAVYTEGWDRRVALTGAAARKLKQDINGLWIYPPTDDAERLLDQAGRFSNG
ncbi:hypothetical protein ABT330_07890 [Streptomyces sp. NPDC000658]|uniref:hypothetical protein n=1 Tax=Streptomyces sp. NPDC000658 TaxID=3154266 RepID=UPI003326B742